MAQKSASSPEVQALLELERREMQTPGTMPENLKSKLNAYRQQGVIPRLKGLAEKMPDQMPDARSEILTVVRKAREAEKLSQDGWFATGFGSGLARRVDGSTATDIQALLNTIGANTAFARLQKMRDESPTGGALGNVTEMELKLLRDSVASLDPGQSDAAFQKQMREIMGRYSDVYRRLGGDERELADAMGEVLPAERQDDDGAATPPASSASPPGPSTPEGPDGGGLDRTNVTRVEDKSPGALQVTTGAVQFETEADRRFAGLVQSILDRGGTVAEANAAAREFGFPETIDPTQWKAALDYNKNAKPGQPRARFEIPKSGARDTTAFEKAAGSPAGAFAAGVANAVTPGLVDEIGGSMESLFTGRDRGEAIADANLRKQLMRETSPGAFMAGEVVGGVATEGGAGKGLALASPYLRGLGAALSRADMGMDAVYGAAYGAGERNDDRLGGAASGGVAGVFGGVLGRGATNTAAGVIAPRVSDGVRALRDRGVRTTLGESIGPKAAAAEEKLMSIPIVGDLVKSAKDRSRADFNRAVLDDSLKEIGQALPEGARDTAAMKFAQGAFNAEYDQIRSAMTVVPDQQLVTDLQAIAQRARDGGLDGESLSRLEKIYKSQVNQRFKGSNQRGWSQLDGDTYKKMMAGLGRLERSTGASNPELSEFIGDMKAAIDNAARRSSPADAVERLDAADRGYALLVRAENAARMRGGGAGSFTPAQYSSAVQRGDSSVRSRAYSRGEALGQELADAAEEVLGSRVSNSGTFDRAAMGGLVTGAAYLEPGTLAVSAGLAGAYSPGVRDVVTAAMTRRSSKSAASIADMVRDRAPLVGRISVPLALPYVADQ